MIIEHFFIQKKVIDSYLTQKSLLVKISLEYGYWSKFFSEMAIGWNLTQFRLLNEIRLKTGYKSKYHLKMGIVCNFSLDWL